MLRIAFPATPTSDNGMHGTPRLNHERVYSERVSGNAFTDPDFARLIAAFDGSCQVVEPTDQLRPAYECAAAGGKPPLIKVLMNPEQ